MPRPLYPTHKVNNLRLKARDLADPRYVGLFHDVFGALRVDQHDLEEVFADDLDPRCEGRLEEREELREAKLRRTPHVPKKPMHTTQQQPTYCCPSACWKARGVVPHGGVLVCEVGELQLDEYLRVVVEATHVERDSSRGESDEPSYAILRDGVVHEVRLHDGNEPPYGVPALFSCLSRLLGALDELTHRLRDGVARLLAHIVVSVHEAALPLVRWHEGVVDARVARAEDDGLDVELVADGVDDLVDRSVGQLQVHFVPYGEARRERADGPSHHRVVFLVGGGGGWQRLGLQPQGRGETAERVPEVLDLELLVADGLDELQHDQSRNHCRGRGDGGDDFSRYQLGLHTIALLDIVVLAAQVRRRPYELYVEVAVVVLFEVNRVQLQVAFADFIEEPHALLLGARRRFYFHVELVRRELQQLGLELLELKGRQHFHVVVVETYVLALPRI
ncbi:polyketide synthase [Babesia caballi]|uniref:Polyketide synthase n=1 Tax=Babesia caballi TaxID=5871 RepID=A0AAV4LVH0_BABCB|nr:polyketide synthase [Babesia caballi]